jgi:hypothetical protein
MHQRGGLIDLLFVGFVPNQPSVTKVTGPLRDQRFVTSRKVIWLFLEQLRNFSKQGRNGTGMSDSAHQS